jgi:outer membrane protein OmpA-like peptidoglycan-associated protein
MVTRTLNEAAAKQWTAAVVVDEGTPKPLGQLQLVTTAKNEYAAKQERDANVAKVTAAVTGAAADNPEVDLLQALDLAGRSVSQSSGPKTIIVIDSGLQTVAPLKFQKAGMLAADPNETATFLAKTNALPDLRGVRLILSGLGDTAPPQAPLGIADRRNLVAIWRAIGTRAGARVDVVNAPLATAPKSGLPPVTQVPVRAPALAVPTVRRHTPVAVELHDQSVHFLPDRAVFGQPKVVAELLRPIAARIVAQRLRVHLTGSTASVGSQSGRRALSLRRAKAVKAVLVAEGVPARSITTTGVGTGWARHVPDLDSHGNLLPGPAAQNRMVLLELSR